MLKNKVTVNSKDADDKDIEVIVKKPSKDQMKESQIVASQSASRAIKSGMLTRENIDSYMRENGLWDDEKADQLTKITTEILSGERQLARGARTATGDKFSKDEARSLSITMRELRFDQTSMLAKQRELDEFTVQGLADNAKFDYLVSVCVYNSEGNSVYKDLEDYTNRSTEPFSGECAAELAAMVYGYDTDTEKNRPENKFLVKYGFAREDGRLINDAEHLINIEGKRIDEDGYYLDDDGHRVDRSGYLIDEDGKPIEDFVPFDEPKPKRIVKK